MNINHWYKKLKKAGDEFAQYINQKGYRGCFDIDFVISKEKKTFAVESNPRRTGGTHVWEAAKYLLGERLRKYVIYSNDVLEVKNNIKTYSHVKRLIRDLFWGNYEGNEGILLSGANMLNFGKVGYIAFSKSKAGLNRLNSEVGKRLGRNTSF